MTVRIEHGDMREVLARLIAEGVTVQSIVTDPPYHLTSIVKRFGSEMAAPAKVGKTGAYARASTGFMGKQWDGGDIAFQPETWRLCYDLLPPGGHLLAFSGTRTYHRMACAIEDAGFEIRDTIAWLYGSGFPKSHNVAKGIDKAAGAEREVVGTKVGLPGYRAGETGENEVYGAGLGNGSAKSEITAPATDAARQWEGWGTALKPALEPICLARKPLAGTVAGNILKYGTGALNINACRVETDGQRPYTVQSWESDQLLCSSCAALAESNAKPSTPAIKASIAIKPAVPTSSERGSTGHADILKVDIGCFAGMRAESTDTNSSTSKSGKTPTDQFPKDTKSTTGTKTSGITTSAICNSCQKPLTASTTQPTGRWPANVITDGSDEVVSAFPDAEVGNSRGVVGGKDAAGNGMFGSNGSKPTIAYADHGSAARFFYSAKADKADRLGSKHPTVKPVDLMRWLIRLITPPVVLVCESCDNGRHDNSTKAPGGVSPLRDVPNSIQASGQSLETSLLFEGLRGNGDASTAEASVRTVRQGIQAGPGIEKSPVLLAEMRDPLDGKTTGKGLRQDARRLHSPLSAGPSQGDARGLHNGASPDSGGDAGQAAQSQRGRASSKRAKGGQPTRELRGDAEAAPRQDTQATAEADRLSALRRDDQNKRACPTCGGALVERKGVVLDPFAGSGTTGMACLAEGIDCILVEREAEYVADIKRRLAHVRGDDTPLFSPLTEEA